MRNLTVGILGVLLTLGCQTAQPPTKPIEAQSAESVVGKKQFVIVLKPVPRLLEARAWTPQDEAIVGEHFQRLQRLTAEGVVLLAGRTLNEDASQFGIVIVEAEDEAKAREIMDGDAAIRGGVMTGELFPYAVALTRHCAKDKG